MKALIYFLPFVFITGCGNKKAHLVDLDKLYRDSAQTYMDRAKMCLDSDFNSHPHKTELARYLAHDTSAVISNGTMDQYKRLISKSATFKVMADSIEWELKKF